MKHLTIGALLVLLALSISDSTAYRILGLFPHPGPSHFKFFHPLLRELAKAGHEVTVVGYFPDKDPLPNYTDYTLVGETSKDAIDLKMVENLSWWKTLAGFFMVLQWGLMSCEKCLESPAMQKVLNDKPYDAVLIENFNSDCMMGVAHLLKAPVVGLSSCVLLPWEYKKHNVLYSPSHNPVNLFGSNNKLGFFQRIFDWFIYSLLNISFELYFQPKSNALVRKHLGDSIPDVRELADNVSMVLVNQHYAATGVRSLPSNVIEVGGLHIVESKPLKDDIKRILDSAKNGAIYISWGSQVRADSLPVEKRDGILRAIGRLEQQVLWKWENETMPNSPKNLYIRSWMPQQDILCHPNVKAFISHGGQLGTSEAIHCGVPIVVVPLFGDQFINAAMLKEFGVASVLNYNQISEETVYNAIKEVLRPEFYQNAKDMSFAFNNRPMKPIDRSMWWVEHVIKTKGRTFAKSNLAETAWYVYYSADIYLFVSFVLFACIIFDIWVIKVLCLRRGKKSGDKKNKVKQN